MRRPTRNALLVDGVPCRLVDRKWRKGDRTGARRLFGTVAWLALVNAGTDLRVDGVYDVRRARPGTPCCTVGADGCSVAVELECGTGGTVVTIVRVGLSWVLPGR